MKRVELDQPRYDQKTFLGRLKHFLQITDIRTLFISDSELKKHEKNIQDYKERDYPLVPVAEAEKLWYSKHVVDAIIHPQTKEKIPLPFRLSAFVPMNVVIVAGMLAPNPSIGNVVFWQFINQSYNIALNHSNRNASNEMSVDRIVKSYAGAVAISCSAAVGLSQLVKKSTSFSPGIRTLTQKFVPFTAVAIAGVANVFMMRWNEIEEGIVLSDQEGNERGKSKKAGLSALSQVAFSRCMTALPCLTFPPIIMTVLERTQWLQKNPRLKSPINLVLITSMLFSGLPVAVAIFPQMSSIPVSRLEPKFHNLKDQQGNPITTLYFNRGL